MRLSQEAIQRMISGRSGGGAGGGSFDPSALAGYATQAWTEENYISKTFFNELLIIHKKVTTVVMDGETEISRTVTTNSVFAPNEIPGTTETTDEETGYVTTVTTEIASIESKKGFWTNYFLSALGLNDEGGGGGGLTLNEPLATINVSGLADHPTSSGQTIVWNGSAWVYGTAGGGTGTVTGVKVGDITYSPVNGIVSIPAYPTSLAWSAITGKPTTIAGYGITDAKIENGTITLGSNSITPLTSFTETDPTVPAWAKQAQKPSYSFSEITGKPTTLSGYGITDAKIENGVITLGGNTITPVTSVAMTVPTGFSISGSPISKTGTLALSYATGYEGFTTELKNKINEIYSWFELDSDGNVKTKDKPNNGGHRGFWSPSFVSALGLNSSGGGGGDVSALTDLVDVAISNPTNGQVLKYNATTGKWYNGNDEGVTTLAWSQITGKPTTIGGYGITDAKIQNGTITLGSNSITPLTSIPDLSGTYVTLTTAQAISGAKTFSVQQAFTVAQGTSPFTVTSSTMVSNLNADMLDDLHKTDFPILSVGSTVCIALNASDDLNNKTSVGTYYTNSQSTAASISNSPHTTSNFKMITMHTGASTYPMQFVFAYNEKIYVRGRSGGSDWRDWRTVAFLDSNVASATKLATARSLWGNNFDGTADINGNITMSSADGTYIQIGGARIVWDNANNALKVVKSDGTTAANFYATGGVSALGLNSSGGGGGDVSALTDLVDVAISNPTNGQVLKYNSTTGKWYNGTDEGVTSLSWSQITGKPTTIAGYGITDAKIENGTITLGANTITPLTSFTETDPTVPAWAKEPNKPSYSFSEITGTATDGQIPNLPASKITSGTFDLARIPDLSDTYVTKLGAQTISGVKTFSVQQAFTVAQGTSPFTVTSTTNVANLNADMLDDLHKTDFPILSVGSTVCIALNASDDLNNKTSVGTYYTNSQSTAASISNSPHTTSNFKMITMHTGASTYPMQFVFAYNEKIYVRGRSGGSDWRDWHTVAFLDSNVASATKLEDNGEHKVWGQRFWINGQPISGDITGSLTGVTNISMNGTISGCTSIDSLLYFDTANSRIGVGKSSPSSKLDVDGTITCTSITICGITLTADNNGIHVNSAGLYADTYVSALGLSSGGGGNATALTDLVDVNISNPTNGQVLKYNSTTGKWYNGTDEGVTSLSWSQITDKPETATRWPAFSEVTSKPTTLAGYGILSSDTLFSNITAGNASRLTTVNKTAWGQTYWTSDGIPDSISGTITVGAGNIVMNNNRYLYWKNTGGTNIDSLRLSSSNNLILGYGACESGYNTYVDGDGVSLRYSGHTVGLRLTSAGNIGIGTVSPSYKLHVVGSIYGDSLTLNGSISGCTNIDSLLYLDTSNSQVIAGTSTAGTFTHSGNTVVPKIYAGGEIGASGGLWAGFAELYYATPYIDFHYGSATYDYTSRIIENESGVLTILAKSSGTDKVAGLKIGGVNGANYLQVGTTNANSTNQSYVQIGNIRLVYDYSNNAIKVQTSTGGAANFYALGAVSALGISSSATGEVAGNLVPSTDGTYELGSSSKGWTDLYLSDGDGATLNIYADSGDAWYNCSNGKHNFEQPIAVTGSGYFTTTGYFGGKVSIGGTNSNSDKLYVNGTVRASGYNNTSDIRLKAMVRRFQLSVEEIAGAPLFTFRWKADGESGKLLAGSSAQYWRQVLPEVVTEDADGTLGMDYGVTALVSVGSVARTVMTHDEEIAAVKRRLSDVEAENEKLRNEIETLKG